MSRLYSLVFAALLASGLAAVPAAAETSPAPYQPSTMQGAAQGGGHPLLDRFNAASHDGRLTLQQAQAAHMPWVTQNFAAIDTQQKGSITMQDILAYRQRAQASQTNASSIKASPANASSINVPATQHAAGGATQFLDRFSAANTTRDGRLTLQQAQAANMPWVTRHFTAIDIQRKGYITVQDVRTYRQQARAVPAAANQNTFREPVQQSPN